MLKGIEINCHSSIKISKGKTIYVDPFKLEKDTKYTKKIKATGTIKLKVVIKDSKGEKIVRTNPSVDLNKTTSVTFDK